MEIRAASLYSGAHADDVDHVAWNPTHPELFVSSSQKDRKVVFWDARRASPDSNVIFCSNLTLTRKSFYPTTFSETHADADWICTGWKNDILCVCRTFIVLPRAGAEPRGSQGYLEDIRGRENCKATVINLHATSHLSRQGRGIVRSVQSCG
jgi:hypothetical protein